MENLRSSIRLRASRIIASQPSELSALVLRLSLKTLDVCLILSSVMTLQMPIDYWKMFTDLMERRAKLIGQRDEAEVELAKMKQLIVSVFALLREDQQKANQQAIDDMEAESAGLQDAIKLVFSTNEGQWMTVSHVRDHLNDIGFDFRQYKANPLASIGTTLKRIADTGFVETTSTGSGTLYRRRATLDKLKMLSDLLGEKKDKTPGLDDPSNPLYTSGTRPFPKKK
jgi:hypothetical protein